MRPGRGAQRVGQRRTHPRLNQAGLLRAGRHPSPDPNQARRTSANSYEVDGRLRPITAKEARLLGRLRQSELWILPAQAADLRGRIWCAIAASRRDRTGRAIVGSGIVALSMIAAEVWYVLRVGEATARQTLSGALLRAAGFVLH